MISEEEEEAARVPGRQGRLSRVIPIAQGLQDAMRRNGGRGVNLNEAEFDGVWPGGR